MTHCVQLRGWCPGEAGVPERLPVPEVAGPPPDERNKTAVSDLREFSAFTGILSIPDHAKIAVSSDLLRYVAFKFLKPLQPCVHSARSQHNWEPNIIRELRSDHMR